MDVTMMQSCFTSVPKVWFGPGCVKKLPDEVLGMGAKSVLLVTDRVLGQSEMVSSVESLLKGTSVKVRIYDGVTGEPSFDQMEEAARQLESEDFDLIVGLGGGSSLDTAKGLSIRLGLREPLTTFAGVEKVPREGIPLVMVPTTSGSGSEVTPIAIFTDKHNGVKVGVVSRFIRARIALVDPELTVGVPPHVTAHTGVDALTHAIEAFVSKNATVTTDMYALSAIRLIAGSLRKAVYSGNDIGARTKMSLGSLYAGCAFANAGVAAVHALAYPLGGRFGIPHGLANAMLLAETCRFNLPACPERFADIGEAFGIPTHGRSTREAGLAAIEAIEELVKDAGIPQSLREIGVPEAAIPAMSEETFRITRLLSNNPRPVTVKEIAEIYRRVW